MIPPCGTKYIIVVDDDVDVHNTREILFRLCANTDPQRDSFFTKGPSDALDQARLNVRSCRLASRSTSTRRRSLRTATNACCPK